MNKKRKIDNYVLLKVLGSGQCGKVYLCQNEKDGK